MEREIHCNLNPNSSYPKPEHQPKNCEPHYTAEPGGCKTLDHDSTFELSIFNAHKYFNEVTINNNRVSPLLNTKLEAERDDITNTHSNSASSSSIGCYANIKNNKSQSSHGSTPTPSSSSSSKACWKSKVGLLSHPKSNSTSVFTRNPFHYQNFIDLSKRIRASLSKPVLLLRRKCLCSDKNSVQVDENTPKLKNPTIATTSPKPQSQNLSNNNQVSRNSLNHRTTQKDKLTIVESQRFQFQDSMNQIPRPLTEGFTFPLFLGTTSPTKPQVVLNVVHEEEEEEPPRDSLQVFQPPSPPKSRVMDEDAASDASSDLFEIESFSGTQTETAITTSVATVSNCFDEEDAVPI